MVFCPEHPKRDQNPNFTPLSKTMSIPHPFHMQSSPPGENDQVQKVFFIHCSKGIKTHLFVLVFLQIKLKHTPMKKQLLTILWIDRHLQLSQNEWQVTKTIPAPGTSFPYSSNLLTPCLLTAWKKKKIKKAFLIWSLTYCMNDYFAR